MKNLLLSLLSINNEEVQIIDYIENGNKINITVSINPVDTYCLKCGCKMNSKGIQQRTLKHPILQNGFTIIITYLQRRYKCKHCNYQTNQKVSFATKSKQLTRFTYINLCNELKNLLVSFEDVAKKYNISTTVARKIFLENVSVPRLPLPEILCIDEVYLNIDHDKKYPVVLLDFKTKEPTDIVISRRAYYLDDYFSRIPLSERRNVKVLVSDMYKPYLRLKDRFFPNAVLVVDAFHVISRINNEIIKYFASIKRYYIKKDNDRLTELNESTNNCFEKIQPCIETVLLRSYTWVFLKKEKDVDWNKTLRYDSYIGGKKNTTEVRNLLFNINSDFELIYQLKELYYAFNDGQYNSREEVEYTLNQLIKTYLNSHNEIFIKLGRMIKPKSEYIINSFNFDLDTDLVLSKTKISNGPIESFNRTVKDLKRNSRGVSNFEVTRARILWATRHNCPFKGYSNSNTK